MADATTLTTDEVPAADRPALWRDWMSRLFFGLESDLYGDTRFDARVQTARAGDVVMTRLDAGRHRVMRRPRVARASDASYLKIVAPWQGSAGVEQDGRRAWARAGSWVIYDTTGSYAIDNPEHVEHLIVMLPKEQLTERGLRLDPLMGRHVGGSCGISRVALETMRSTFQELPSMTDDTARSAGSMILELVRLSLQELAGRESSATQLEAFRDRVRAHIGQHLQDPHLSLDSIAQALNCSKRHLYNAFGDEDDTPAHYILRRRLQACMRDLRNPALATRSITDIAFAWGFNNGAHFSRVFREHAGLTPSDFRKAAQRQADDSGQDASRR